jgi:hypothetical protein
VVHGAAPCSDAVANSSTSKAKTHAACPNTSLSMCDAAQQLHKRRLALDNGLRERRRALPVSATGLVSRHRAVLAHL